MIDVSRLRKCCYDCKYPDLELYEYTSIADFTQHNVMIYCKHKEVCRDYLNEKEATVREKLQSS